MFTNYDPEDAVQNTWIRLVLILLTVASIAPNVRAADSDPYSLRLINMLDASLNGVPVSVPTSKLPERLHGTHLNVKTKNGQNLSSALEDPDGDGTPDRLVINTHLEAKGSTTYRVTAGDSSTGNRSDATLPVLKNTDLAVRVLRTEKPGVTIRDRTSGKRLVRKLSLKRINPENLRTRITSDNPVRTVVDQTYSSGDLRITQQYILLDKKNVFRFKIRVKNTSEQTVTPDLLTHRTIVSGKQGPLLHRNPRKKEIVSVNYWTSTRRNVLYANRSTGYSMGIAFHSPNWERFGIIPWSPPRTTFDGVYILSRSAGPGQAPPSTKHTNITKNGSIGLGAYRNIQPSEQRARYLTRHMGKRTKVTLDPGETETLGFSLWFYRDHRDRAIQKFSTDHERTGQPVTVFDETGTPLHVAGAPYYVREPFQQKNRWNTDDSANLTVRNGLGTLSTSEPGTGMRIPFTRDFRHPTEIRGEISKIPENTEVEVVLRNLDEQTSYRLGTYHQSFRIPVNFTADSAFSVSDSAPSAPVGAELELNLVARNDERDEESEETLRAVFDRITVAWPSPKPPEMLSPDPEFELTDIALAFDIMPRTPQQCERGYDIQVSESREFENADSYRFSNEIRTRSRMNKSHEFIPETVYSPGTYYWRVRATGTLGEKSAWSEPASFVIGNDDHTRTPPRRTISPDQPLFLFARGRNNSKQDIRSLYQSLPEPVRKHSGADVPFRLWNWVKGTDFPVLVKAGGGHVISGAANLPKLERLFRKHPRILGWTASESKFPHRQATRYVKLAGKYGRRWGLLGGSVGGGIGYMIPGANRTFYDTLNTHSSYFLNLMKSQNPYTPFAGYVNLVGLWLSGRQKHWGAEAEWFQPHKVMPDDEIRGIDWVQPLLMGLAHGATVYRLESFMSYNHRPTGWHPREDKFGEAWTRAVGPFFVDLLKHDLIPTKRQVRKKVRVALQPSPKMAVAHSRKTETYPIDFVYGIHGIDDHWRQWMQHETRYYMVPVLPVRATEEERTTFEHVIRPSQFDSADEARTFLNNVYPPDRSDAFSVLVGDTGVITNSEGKKNDARPQDAFLSLSKGPVKSIRETVHYHAYTLLKQSAGQLFLHVNNYRQKSSTITLRGKKPLSLQTRPDEALASVIKSNGGKTLRITLTHAHERGVVRVYVK